MTQRHDQSHIEAWKTTGFLLIPNFFTEDEIAPIARDYERLYEEFRPQSSQAVDFKSEGQIGAFHGKQFLHTESLPFDAGPEMNLLSLHPALIALAKDLLGVPEVHLYQSHSWAKFTGEADYDQVHHCDCLLYTSPSPRDNTTSRMPSSA